VVSSVKSPDPALRALRIYGEREVCAVAMNALMIGWGAPVRGREQKALDAFQEVLQFYGKLQQQGEIQSFEPVALEPHGGELAGFLLVKGDPEKLARIRGSEEFIALTTRAQLLVDDIGIVGAFVGDNLQSLFADFGRQIATLA
jgi:hypothetical protein